MKISIDKLKAGMILDADVYRNNGSSILLSEGMRLNNILISRLVDANISEVEIRVDDKINLKKFGRPEIKENLDKNFNKVQNSIKKVMTVKEIKAAKVNSFSKKLLDFISDSFSENTLYILESIASNENSDDELFTHVTHVAVLSHMIGKWLNYDDVKLKKLTLAALYHDIGMLKINEVILNKNQELSYYEFRDIKKHCRHARDLLTEWGFDDEVVKAVFHHHERMDGSGYPLKLKGNDINEFSKIIAVADVFDALTSHKPHRNSFSILEALVELEEESINKLDTRITKLFISKFFQNYLGQGVELSNNKKGKIIRLDSNNVTRPLIACTDGEILDLAQNKEISITNFL